MHCRWCLLVVLLAAGGVPAGASDSEFGKPPLGLKALQIPADNPLTAEKVELGKQLYFDKRLSRDDTISCASCHDPKKGWSNGEAFATGVRGQVGGRSAPTIISWSEQNLKPLQRIHRTSPPDDPVKYRLSAKM